MTRTLVARLASIVPLALALVGCGRASLARSPYEIITRAPRASVAGAVPEVSAYEWTIARDRLARVRHGVPDHPYVERVRVSITDPRTGGHYEARGAVAVSPSRAARMLLVGPGGTTALDVWVTKDKFRFVVPGINVEKRGGRDPAEARGLPIGMLRWWFLSPLDGRLLIARSTPAESVWVLRDGSATVTVRSDGRRFIALRREGEALEAIEWLGRGLFPTPGARGRYVDDRFGLRVEIVVEDVLPQAPDPDAFTDPDDQGTEL